MTLFRKVFQNQSTPTTVDETLGAEALRKAFMETSDSRVLPLDPFVAAQEAGEQEEEGRSPQADLMDQFFASSQDVGAQETLAEGGDAYEAAGALDAPLRPEEKQVVKTSQETLEESVEDTVEVDNSDADIAAVLAQTKMMETAPKAEVPVSEASTEAPRAPDALTQVVDPDAPAMPEAAPAITMPETEDAQNENAQDLVAFAQQQLQALDGGRGDGARADDPAPVDLAAVTAPAAGRAGRRAGRVKTRMLGFNRSEQDVNDPVGSAQNATARAQHEKFPVGWLVVVDGPGVGHSFSIFSGASMIGRGEDQVIKLDFGDNSISRNNHAAIAYDEEENKFYIGHGGKSNIIRRNARPVLSTEELHHADLLRIGETTLRFVALCGSDFKWEMTGGNDAPAL